MVPSLDPKTELDREISRRFRSTRLNLPVIGMESEFNVWLDEVEINPEPYWKHPSAFIDQPLLKREKTSMQLPTGGAVYFDRGVIEVVTPVIELASSCTARMVRNLWEQIGFVREQLTNWGHKTGHTVRLQAYSSHYNISYEMPKREQSPSRNEEALALLLAYILPVPVMLVASNRRSTGVGVRPRGERIEITVDFTPDPGMMIAAAALIVGIVREVMTWPSYDLSVLQNLPFPVIEGVVPGKHTTRRGWLTKDFHYHESPYTAEVDAPLWPTRFGKLSLRRIARQTAWFFRKSIRAHSDPFSLRLLFAILDGRAPSLLELTDRPTAYQDIGRLCRWGSVIHELKSFESELGLQAATGRVWETTPFAAFRELRQQARAGQERGNVGDSVAAAPPQPQQQSVKGGDASGAPIPRSRTVTPSRGSGDRQARLIPTRPAQYIERRGFSLLRSTTVAERRAKDRRKRAFAIPFPDRRLSRSAYEQVFLKLVSGGRLRVGREVYKPVGMKGWYHALFRRESDGAERMMTIDQLLKRMNDWV